MREANEGSRSAQSFVDQYITSAREIVVKYDQHFFLRELMQKQKSKDKVESSLGDDGQSRNNGGEEERKQSMD